MGFLIGVMTFFLVLDCIVLIFLVLIQLPKKEAGAGLAFGGGTTDALFGAGSGTVLTKITKYAAGIFFVMAILLAIIQKNYHGRSSGIFKNQPARSGAAAPAVPAGPHENLPAAPAATTGTGTNALLTPPLEQTNLPAAATNAAPVSAP